jgi:ribosome biogenesis protein BMS1
VRTERRFTKLKIPKSLQSNLPFKSKPKLTTKKLRPTLINRRAVVMDPEEKKIVSLIQQINTLKHEKDNKRIAKEKVRKTAYLKKKAVVEERKAGRKRDRVKEFYEKMGKTGGGEQCEGPPAKRFKSKKGKAEGGDK